MTLARRTAACQGALGICMLFAGLAASPVFAADSYESEKHAFTVETVVRGLDHPWSLAFLPDGAMLVTERSGALRLISGGKLLDDPVTGTPEVAASGQGGLLDVVLDPNFADNNLIYLSFSEPGDDDTAGTAVLRAKLVRDGGAARLTNRTVIFRMGRKTGTAHHFGSRLVFAPDGMLYVTVGERGDGERAQDPFDHAGSVIRIRSDGSVPDDNPFADGRKGLKEIWSTGHRNPQGATLNTATGEVWTVEHGARGGDEINIPRSGKNYGWPVISYGRHYSGAKIGVGTKKTGMEQPVHYWDPSIAPSGLAFYDGAAFPKWKGNLFVGALKFRMLVRLELDGDKVVGEERLIENRYGRIRDVRVGPKGAIWLLTDQRNGLLLKLSPK